jgi:hypothetical protein
MRGARDRAWRRLAAAAAAVGCCALAGSATAAVSIEATEGAPFSGTVASFASSSVCSPALATITINWGDGTQSAGTGSPGTSIAVSGSHTYAEEGQASGSVSYACPPGAGSSARGTFAVQIADAPLHATGATLSGLASQSVSGTVATFSDTDPTGAPGDYTATIDWGDSTPASATTISAAAGRFAVQAAHTYAAAGDYTATVTISDAGGSQATAQTSVQVGASGPQTVSVTPGTRFSGPVATFTPHCLLSTAATRATATIDWGDGQSSPAQTLITNGATEFDFNGTHTYAHAGTFTGVVSGSYTCGSKVSALPPIPFTGVINPFSSIELRAQGLDITQGIIDDNYLLVPSGGASGLAYRGFGFSPPDTSNDPLPGISPLVENNPTVVRLYADAHGASASGAGPVTAVLYGSSHGHPLPGSPLFAQYGPQSLPDSGEPDPAPVFLPERVADANAYTFRLPASWTSTGQPIDLTGKVLVPTPSFISFCTTASCTAKQSFTMSGVTFVHLPSMTVAPVQMIRPGESAAPPPASVYARALLTEPGGANYTVEPYVATIDPSDVVNNPKSYDPNGDLNSGYLQFLENWGNAYMFFNTFAGNPRPDLISGVNIDQRGVTPCCHSTYDYPAEGFDLVSWNRPLTSVGHELGHDLGRNHSDEPTGGCGGSGGPWPPDHRGDIQGIGLDMSVYPYKVLYPGLPGEPSQWYDKMSYCASTNETGSSNDAWTSPYGWLHSISALSLYGQKVGRAPDVVPAAANSNLVVTGVMDSSGARITSVQPSATALPQPASSSFQLLSRDSAGRILARTNLFAQLTHDNHGASYLAFQATVPARTVHSISVTANGSVLTTRVRSPKPPRVHVLAPVHLARVGGRRSVTVRWKATEAGHAHLVVAVSYSADGGRHWRVIYLGPNRGRALLPSWYFAGSRDARIRVTASDGFDQTSATSARFTALGSPPQVAIAGPLHGLRIAGDARLTLSGTAFDQNLHVLRGRRLEWFDGTVALGHGATLNAPPLPAGRNRIRLVARDAAGRTASATVMIRVTAVKLSFLHLHVPAQIARHARQLVMKASSTIPVTLTVAGHRFRLAPKAKALRLTVAPGQRPLLLELSVPEQGVSVPFAVRVLRR